MPAVRPGTIGSYVLAVLSVLAATLLQMALDPYLVEAHYILFFAAVMVTTLISGLGAGLLCSVLSIVSILFFFVPPQWSFGAHFTDIFELALFGVVMLANVIIAAGLRFAAESYRDLTRTLEQRVDDRTEALVQQSRELDQKNLQLREANEEIMAMYERGGIFMARLNLDGVVVDANRASVEDLGYARAEIVGKRIWECDLWRVSPETGAWIRKTAERALAGEPSRGEISYLTGNGEERVTEIGMTSIKDDAGRVVSIVVAGLDVTERARQYQATFENAAVGIAHIGTDLRFIRVNEAFCGIFGYSAIELNTKSIPDIIHPDDRMTALADLERMRDGTIDSYIMERRYLHSGGAIVWVHASVSAVRKSSGSVDHFVFVVQDISASKLAEQLLQRQADLLNQSHDAILTWQIGGRGIVYWSRGAEALYGYTANEAFGRTSHELLQTRAILPVEEIEAEIVRHGSWYGELTHTTRDGRQIVVESRIVRVSYDGETYALETNRDITERKHAEEQVRLLMREMNHRGKNMLSLVQAIARQTAGSDPEHFIERFTDRIQALAANQDLLVRTRWKGVDVGDLVCAQLAHFSDLIGSKIHLSGSKLRLNGAAAQAIGMALHELATNASKYGALADSGHVDITWLADGNHFTVRWQERDGPKVRPPERRGFGNTVIQTMAQRALDGEVLLEYDPAGIVWQLTCPAANALEQS